MLDVHISIFLFPTKNCLHTGTRYVTLRQAYKTTYRLLNTTFNSEIKSDEHDGYKRLLAVQVPATVEPVVELLPHGRRRRAIRRTPSTTLSCPTSITAQKKTALT